MEGKSPFGAELAATPLLQAAVRLTPALLVRRAPLSSPPVLALVASLLNCLGRCLGGEVLLPSLGGYVLLISLLGALILTSLGGGNVLLNSFLGELMLASLGILDSVGG